MLSAVEGDYDAIIKVLDEWAEIPAAVPVPDEEERALTMSDLQELIQQLSTATTEAFMRAIDELNAKPNGTVYAAVGLLDSGIVGVSLMVNTAEHLELARGGGTVQVDDPYWEVNPAEFQTTIWQPFEGVDAVLNTFHNGYWDGLYGTGGLQPDDFLAPIIQQAYAQADVATRVVTDYPTTLLVGLGYSSPEESQLAHILAASQALNTPEWHQKVVATFGGDQS